MESQPATTLGPWGQFGMTGLVAGVLVTLVAYLLRRLVDGMLTQNQTLMQAQVSKLDEIKGLVSQNIEALKDMQREIVDTLRDLRDDIGRANLPQSKERRIER